MKSLVSSRATAMRGKAISSGERKMFFCNAVITLTFQVPRIVRHGVKSPSKIRPDRKKKFNKLDQFNLGVVRRTG